MNKRTGKQSAGRMIYRWILFAATLAAVGWFIAHNYREVSRFDLEFDPISIAGSFCAVLAAYLVRFLVWMRLSAMLGLRAPALRTARAYYLSLLGRYIPGKVGLALVRIEAYAGYPADRVVMATGIELVCALAAALLLAFAGLALTPVNIPVWLRWLPLACVAPLAAALHPMLLGRATNTLLRLIRRQPLERVPGYRANIVLVLLYTIPGLLHGLGLFILLHALSSIPIGFYPAVTGAYYIASLAGLVAFFAPGGLGVREGILLLVLPALVGKESAIVAAIAIRLVTIAAEVALASFFAAIARRPGGDAATSAS